MDPKAKSIAHDVSKRLERGEPWRGFTRAERILYTMRDGGWHNGRELVECAGWRFGSAIFEIRHTLGIEIEKRMEAPRADGLKRLHEWRVA